MNFFLVLFGNWDQDLQNMSFGKGMRGTKQVVRSLGSEKLSFSFLLWVF